MGTLLASLGSIGTASALGAILLLELATFTVVTTMASVWLRQPLGS